MEIGENDPYEWKYHEESIQGQIDIILTELEEFYKIPEPLKDYLEVMYDKISTWRKKYDKFNPPELKFKFDDTLDKVEAKVVDRNT